MQLFIHFSILFVHYNPIEKTPILTQKPENYRYMSYLHFRKVVVK